METDLKITVGRVSPDSQPTILYSPSEGIQWSVIEVLKKELQTDLTEIVLFKILFYIALAKYNEEDREQEWQEFIKKIEYQNK